MVWQDIQELGHVRDFFQELRDEQGGESDYYRFFLRHYNHCLRILRSPNSGLSTQTTEDPVFMAHLDKLKRTDEMQKSKSLGILTWQMMELEMNFDVKSSLKK